MSPTPVTTSELTQAGPSVYTWEATDEEVAARYRVPFERIARFDLNTSPEPPALADRILRAGRFERPVSEYPPADYRRLAPHLRTVPLAAKQTLYKFRHPIDAVYFSSP